MTKSLVTGGAGFIGSHIVEELLELGHEVVVIDNEYSDNDNFVWRDDVENHKESILNYSKTRKLYKNVDYVFHAAAEARIGPAIKNPINAVKVNSLGTCTVLQCAREAGVKRVMYSSTSSGYGLNSSPNIETQPDDCEMPYSVSRSLVRKCARCIVNYIIYQPLFLDISMSLVRELLLEDNMLLSQVFSSGNTLQENL